MQQYNVKETDPSGNTTYHIFVIENGQFILRTTSRKASPWSSVKCVCFSAGR